LGFVIKFGAYIEARACDKDSGLVSVDEIIPQMLSKVAGALTKLLFTS
jgi:hypothetical protein